MGKSMLTANEFVIVFMLLCSNMNMQLMRNNSCDHWCYGAIGMEWLHWKNFFCLLKKHKYKKGHGLNGIYNTGLMEKISYIFNATGIAIVFIFNNLKT